MIRLVTKPLSEIKEYKEDLDEIKFNLKRFFSLIYTKMQVLAVFSWTTKPKSTFNLSNSITLM